MGVIPIPKVVVGMSKAPCVHTLVDREVGRRSGVLDGHIRAAAAAGVLEMDEGEACR